MKSDKTCSVGLESLRRRFLFVLLGMTIHCTQLGGLAEAQSKGSSVQAAGEVEVPAGFSATLFADDDLAHDIYCMTIDSQGRVVVSGMGYIKILIDTDQDGVADSAKTFANGPKSGAQGMYFHGTDLFCVGDGGLLRYQDKNQDDQADGPPQTFLKFKTGGEHHVHSIQRGPDDWWYLIAGNNAGIDDSYVTTDTSPVKHPQAGTVFRLKPDLSGGEVVAHGFRNSYDFAFNSRGDIFTFDSDGERDVSLPWYRPTRVFHVVTGAHAGWSTRSWKSPHYFADMPPVLAEFGRGSPTGVACYQHTAFGADYQDSLFVLDWTYGRVLNLKLKPDENLASYRVDAAQAGADRPHVFMSGKGQFGFAPTDVEIAPDGSLLVCVGGRGTRGGIYRVTRNNSPTTSWPGPTRTANEKLKECLRAPQPLSSWSRAGWEKLAAELGDVPFRATVTFSKASVKDRVRAIEILTSKFGGLKKQTLKKLAADPSPLVRARAIWSWKRTQSSEEVVENIAPFLADPVPSVGRAASEALLGIPGELTAPEIVSAFLKRASSSSRFDRMAAARAMPQLSSSAFKSLALQASKAGWGQSLNVGYGHLGTMSGFNEHAFRVGLPILQGKNTEEKKLEAVRLMQLGLGDVTPVGKLPAVFDGYAPRLDLKKHERNLDDDRIRLAESFPTGSERLDYELARLLSMLEPFNSKLLTKILTKITSDSHPTTDLHYLIVAARIPTTRDSQQREAIAKGLIGLNAKLKARNLNLDSNWDPRLTELYKTLIEYDPLLPDALVEQPSFGRPGHVVYLSRFPADILPKAVEAFAKQITKDDEYQWSHEVVFVFEGSENAKHRALVRDQFDNFGVRNAVLVVLSKKPAFMDQAKFIAGLESGRIEVVDACATALADLPSSTNGNDRASMIRCLRRLGESTAEYKTREKLVRLLQQSTSQDLGFEFGKPGYKPQTEVIQKWTDWVTSRHPEAADRILGASQDELKNLKELLGKVAWKKGRISAGRKLFEKRACVQCHGGRTALGPDLAGATSRFSRDDLFTAIVLPNRDVSSRYQTTVIAMNSGKVYTGLIIYEAVDGVLLRNSTNQTFRIETRDIDFRRKLPQSLMPAGLLKDLKEDQLADLYAYLKSLR
jgi:putative membrane-bound dehydrogenase-like protein